MKNISKVTLCLLLLLSFVLTACEKTNKIKDQAVAPDRLKNKEEIVVALLQDNFKKGFDPSAKWGEYGITLMQSKLMDIDADNNLVNDLATDYSVSKDGLIWTFKIRADVICHDGEKLTAKDVAFTYNNAKKLASSIDLTKMESAIAVNDTTVEIKLTEPNSTFLYDTAMLGIVPEHAYKDSASYSANPIGSGPYKFVGYEQGQQLLLERNDDYYGKVPKFKKLTLVEMEPDTIYSSLQTGAVDVGIVSEGLAQDPIAGYHLEVVDSYDYRAIALPAVKSGGEINGREVGNNVTSDSAIRQALAIGINRQEMFDSVLYGYGEPANDFFDNLPWGIKEETSKVQDNQVDKANKILEDAGWKLNSDGVREKDDIKASFVLMYPSGDATRQSVSEAFKVQAAKLGIDVELAGLSWDEMLPRSLKDATLIGGGNFSPAHLARRYYSKNISKDWQNQSSYSNSTIDKYIENAFNEMDKDASVDSWKKVLWDGKEGASIMGDSPYLVIGYLKHLYFVRDGVNIGKQHYGNHDRDMSVLANISEWDFEEGEGK